MATWKAIQQQNFLSIMFIFMFMFIHIVFISIMFMFMLIYIIYFIFMYGRKNYMKKLEEKYQNKK